MSSFPFIVVVNVLKCVYFEANRYGCQHHRWVVSILVAVVFLARVLLLVLLLMLLPWLWLRFVELTQNYLDCGNLTRCSRITLLQLETYIESVDKRKYADEIYFDFSYKVTVAFDFGKRTPRDTRIERQREWEWETCVIETARQANNSKPSEAKLIGLIERCVRKFN